jgi:hypothetical protein
VTSTTLAVAHHYQCYETRRQSIVASGLEVVDQFGPSTVDVLRPRNLCLPADKNGEDPSAPADPDHLAEYDIDQDTPFTRVFNVAVTNQFGTVVVDVVAPDTLQVPTTKGLSVPPPPPVSPDVDHFKCYRIRRSSGEAAFVPVGGVQVVDQLGSATITVESPTRLCAPADKNDETPGAETHPVHLLCYDIARSPFGDLVVLVNNQFGRQTFELIRRTQFCVPSTTVPSGSPSGAFLDGGAAR